MLPDGTVVGMVPETGIASFDHLVLATPDLAATTAWLAAHTGVMPSPGGQHVGKGTRNALCSIGPTSYLEIVGPDPEQSSPPHPRPFGIDDLAGAALVSWAIAVADMNVSLAAARSMGFDPGPASPMQRRRPDGLLLCWTLTNVFSPAVPFLIDWLDSPHPATTAAPGLRVTSLSARHPDPEKYQQMMTALRVEIPVTKGVEALRAEISGPGGAVHLPELL